MIYLQNQLVEKREDELTLILRSLSIMKSSQCRMSFNRKWRVIQQPCQTCSSVLAPQLRKSEQLLKLLQIRKVEAETWSFMDLKNQRRSSWRLWLLKFLVRSTRNHCSETAVECMWKDQMRSDLSSSVSSADMADQILRRVKTLRTKEGNRSDYISPERKGKLPNSSASN